MHPYQPILEAPRRDVYTGLGHDRLYNEFNVSLEELPIEEEDDKPRRRTSVACVRCRKRKIRCSGDPGDNTGCNACKSARKDPKECEFRRVGSESLHVFAHHLNGKKTLTTSASFDYGHRHVQPSLHRPSLPNMSAHIARPAEYGERPSRHDSFGYCTEDYYPSKTASHRAPSVAENRLSMTSLQDTLPPQARHLPMPQQLLNPQAAPTLNWRPQGGIHDRGSMSWAPDHVKSDGFKTVSYEKKEPEFGYHITHAAPSPKVSPKTQPDATDFGTTTLKPIQQTLALQTGRPAVPCYIPTGPLASNLPTSYYAPTAVMTNQGASYLMPPPPPPAQAYLSPVVPNQPKPSIYRPYPQLNGMTQQTMAGQLYYTPYTASPHMLEPIDLPRQNSSTYMLEPVDLRRHSASTFEAGLDLCNFSTAATEHNAVIQRSPRTLEVPFNSPGHIYAPQAQRNDVAESLQRQASFELQKRTLNGGEAAAQ